MGVQTGGPFKPRLKKITYPISEKVLNKWVANKLTLKESVNGRRHYVFHYTGSTCTNGGIQFFGDVHAVCAAARRSVVIEKGWIEFTEEQQENARKMCAYKSSGEEFIAKLKEAGRISGKSLEKIIRENVPLNPAGCFCTDAMLNHKWKWVASTIHYSIIKAEKA